MDIDKISLTLTFPKRRGIPSHGGPHRELQGLVRREKNKSKLGKRLYCGFHGRKGETG